MSNKWISNNPELLPDFIIGGAMKCATTTLHDILSSHPDVYIPRGECHFFDIDNILQHPNYNIYRNANWLMQSMNKNTDKMWEWNFNKFKKTESKIVGEDSTTYLASNIAAERISMQKKEIKMIFILRQPSLRAYSNYLHILKNSKAIYNFEDTIRYQPHKIITRSLYRDQLKNYYNCFPSNKIKVILFEDLIKEPDQVLKNLSTFLNIDYNFFDSLKFPKSHINKSYYPKYLNLCLAKNKILNIQNKLYKTDLPTRLNRKNKFYVSIVQNLHKIINPLKSEPVPIKQSTKKFLDDYFYEQLIGINELVGKDILSKWFN